MNEIADKIMVRLGKGNKPLSFRVKQTQRKPRPQQSDREQQRNRAVQIALLSRGNPMQNESVKKAIKTIKKAAKAVKKVGGKIVKVMGTRPTPEDVMITGRYEGYDMNEAAPDIGQNLKGMPRRAARKAAYALKNIGKGKTTVALYQKAMDRHTRKLGSQAKRVGNKLQRATSDFRKRMGMDEAAQPETFKVGDRVRMGMAQRGGAGVKGKIVKIDGNTVYVESDFREKYGPHTYKGQMKNLTKESVEVSEASLKKALMTGDKVARQKASYRQSQLNAQRQNYEQGRWDVYVSPMHPDYPLINRPTGETMSSRELAANARANYLHFSPRSYGKKLDRAVAANKQKAAQKDSSKRDEVNAKKQRKERISKALRAIGKQKKG